jgi:hypothetical protein
VLVIGLLARAVFVSRKCAERVVSEGMGGGPVRHVFPKGEAGLKMQQPGANAGLLI